MLTGGINGAGVNILNVLTGIYNDVYTGTIYCGFHTVLD